MAHFLNKKYKTKISDKDYDIIATGRKYSFGKKIKTDLEHQQRITLK